MKIEVGSHRVSEARLIISAATTFSLVSVSVCLLTIPRLYREINILYEEVRADVAQFRVETDAVCVLIFNFILKILKNVKICSQKTHFSA